MNEEYTREELINICEKAFVDTNKWHDRDSYDAQCQLGQCYVLLKDNCDFKIIYGEDVNTDEDTIWLEISSTGFEWFEGGNMEKEFFYLPTLKRLNESEDGDWY